MSKKVQITFVSCVFFPWLRATPVSMSVPRVAPPPLPISVSWSLSLPISVPVTISIMTSSLSLPAGRRWPEIRHRIISLLSYIWSTNHERPSIGSNITQKIDNGRSKKTVPSPRQLCPGTYLLCGDLLRLRRNRVGDGLRLGLSHSRWPSFLSGEGGWSTSW